MYYLGHMGLFGGFGMLVVWGGFIWLIFWLLQQNNSSKKDDDALSIAKERYARGEITKKAFDQLKNDLR